MMVNIGVIAALFLLLIAGAYLLTKFDTEERSKILTQDLASDIVSGGFDRRPPPPPMAPIRPVFSVTVDSSGRINSESSSPPLSIQEMRLLVKQTLKASREQGTISFQNFEFYYLRTNIPLAKGWLLIFHDISRERAVQRALLTALSLVGIVCLILSMFGSLYMANRAMVPIKQAWQQQKDFLADASHELRTPLTIIRNSIEAIRESPQETLVSQDKWLTNIEEESESMVKLVNSLLFLAQTDTQSVLDVSEFPLGEALQAAAESMKPVADAKGVALSVSNLIAIPFSGDKNQIRQLVTILLDNAVRHTPSGGRIVLTLQRTSNTAVITVSDTGEGMGEEHLDKIFDRFYQITPSRLKGSAGLGLSIAKSIVANHRGTIRVTSTKGVGSTFTVQLPISG
jgi:signal transduction histidine kinase